MIEVSFIILSISLHWCPHLTPRRGQGGQMEVKSQFCSNLHQIWWEEAFLQVIEGSLSKTMILIRFFCIIHPSPSIRLEFYYKRPINLVFLLLKLWLVNNAFSWLYVLSHCSILLVFAGLKPSPIPNCDIRLYILQLSFICSNLPKGYIKKDP